MKLKQTKKKKKKKTILKELSKFYKNRKKEIVKWK